MFIGNVAANLLPLIKALDDSGLVGLIAIASVDSHQITSGAEASFNNPPDKGFDVLALWVEGTSNG